MPNHKLTIKNGEGICSCGAWIRPVSEHSTDSKQSRIRRGFNRHLERIARGEFNPWEIQDPAEAEAEAEYRAEQIAYT